MKLKILHCLTLLMLSFFAVFAYGQAGPVFQGNNYFDNSPGSNAANWVNPATWGAINVTTQSVREYVPPNVSRPVLRSASIFYDDQVFTASSFIASKMSNTIPVFLGQSPNYLQVMHYPVTGIVDGGLKMDMNTRYYVEGGANNSFPEPGHNLITKLFDSDFPYFGRTYPSFALLDGALYVLYYANINDTSPNPLDLSFRPGPTLNALLIARDPSTEADAQPSYNYPNPPVQISLQDPDDPGFPIAELLDLVTVNTPDPNGSFASVGVMFFLSGGPRTGDYSTLNAQNNFSLAESGIHFAIFTGTPSSNTLELQTQSLPAPISNYTFVEGSLDAIHYSGGDNDGIVLSGMTRDSSGNLVPKLFFLEWNSSTSNYDVTEYPIPAYTSGQSPWTNALYGVTRITWGPMPLQDASNMKGDVFSLAFTVINGSSPNVEASTYFTQVDIFGSNSDTQLYNINTMNGAINPHDNANYITTLGPYSMHWFHVPAPVSGTADYSTVNLYNVIFGRWATAEVSYENEIPFFNFNLLDRYYDLHSLTLSPSNSSPETYSTESIDNLSPDALQAMVESWQLVGIITGPPPVPAASSKFVTSTVKIGNSETSSSTTTNTNTSSTSLSASTSLKFLPLSPTIGGGIKNATSTAITDDSSYKTSFQDTFFWESAARPGAPDASRFQTGYMLISQPIYSRLAYTVANAIGQALNVDYSILWTSGSQSIFYNFFLTSPNAQQITLGENGASIQLQNNKATPLYSFPTNSDGTEIVQWPSGIDIEGWANNVPSSADLQVISVVPASDINTINSAVSSGTDNSDSNQSADSNQTLLANLQGTPTNIETTSVFVTEKSATKDTNENEISFNAGVKLFGFDVKEESKMQTKTESTISISKDSTFEISYGKLDSDSAYTSIVIKPLFYKATVDNAPWVPTIFAKQRPWLLTWRVVNHDNTSFPGLTKTRWGDLVQSIPDSELKAEQQWYYSLWAGHLWEHESKDWYYWNDFQQWSWLDPESKSEAFYAWLTDTGWIYTDETNYPAFYNFSTGTWQAVYLDSAGDSVIVDLSDSSSSDSESQKNN